MGTKNDLPHSIPDKLYKVIASVLCLEKRHSRGTTIELPNQN